MTRARRIQRFVASFLSAASATGKAARTTVTDVHDEHADFVWRSLQRLGVRDADLEDALQDVFVVVHKRLATFDGSSKMTTWLFGICLRVSAAHRRRAHVRRETPTDELDERADDTASTSPEDAALRREARERVERALDALTPEKRSAFVMFEIEGVAATEIAEMLGVPVGTVYSRLSAARVEFAEAVTRLERRERSRGVG
jgi:RNA polymerase sigma-70 factor (ECF subfamily)